MFTEFLNAYLGDILTVALCALFGFLGMGLKAIAKALLTDQTKQTLAKTAVHYVEQVFKTLHGKEKLERACGLLSEQLAERGIFLDGKEIVILIEAAVGEMNQAFRQSA